MVSENKCALCRIAAPRTEDSLLCQGCADAVNLVMPADVYEANFCRDRQAQLAQAKLLVQVAKARATSGG
jgi:hypothetical protein